VVREVSDDHRLQPLVLLGDGTAARDFIHGSAADKTVRLSTPSAAGASAWQCSRTAPVVRLVRCVASNGQVQVLATNLSAHEPPAVALAAHHQGWRIEEAFKRLKFRVRLEAVAGLPQQALIIDVDSKILAGNIASLMALAALSLNDDDLLAPEQHVNRSYAAALLARALVASAAVRRRRAQRHRPRSGIGCIAPISRLKSANNLVSC